MVALVGLPILATLCEAFLHTVVPFASCAMVLLPSSVAASHPDGHDRVAVTFGTTEAECIFFCRRVFSNTLFSHPCHPGLAGPSEPIALGWLPSSSLWNIRPT